MSIAETLELNGIFNGFPVLDGVSKIDRLNPLVFHYVINLFRRLSKGDADVFAVESSQFNFNGAKIVGEQTDRTINADQGVSPQQRRIGQAV